MNFFNRKKTPATEPAEPICESPVESNPFIDSLENLTPDNIAPKPPKKKYTTQEIISEVIRRGIIAVCAVVFVWSAARLAQSFIDY